MKLSFSSKMSYYDKRRGLVLPKQPSEDLAEFFGVIFGDGFCNKYKKWKRSGWEYKFSITGHSTDDLYYFKKHLIPLIEKLFNIKPKLMKLKGQKTIRLLIRSRGLYYFLKDLGFSSPKDDLRVPSWICSKKEYIFAFIRGLADTDFSLRFSSRGDKKNFYPVICTGMKNEALVRDLVRILKNIGFKVYSRFGVKVYDKRGFESITNRIYINGKRNLELWMELISFKNPKHLTKYILWKKYGFCPPFTNLEERLNMLVGRARFEIADLLSLATNPAS